MVELIYYMKEQEMNRDLFMEDVIVNELNQIMNKSNKNVRCFRRACA